MCQGNAVETQLVSLRKFTSAYTVWLRAVHARKAKMYAGLVLKELLLLSVCQTGVCWFQQPWTKLPSTSHTHPLQSTKRLCCALPVEGGKREPVDGVHIQGHKTCKGEDLKLPTVVDIVG